MRAKEKYHKCSRQQIIEMEEKKQNSDPKQAFLKYREDIRKIGFYNVIEIERKTYHIETNVVLNGDIRIRTKIWRKGRVVGNVDRVFLPTENRNVVHLAQAAGQQHAAALQNLEQ